MKTVATSSPAPADGWHDRTGEHNQANRAHYYWGPPDIEVFGNKKLVIVYQGPRPYSDAYCVGWGVYVDNNVHKFLGELPEGLSVKEMQDTALAWMRLYKESE